MIVAAISDRARCCGQTFGLMAAPAKPQPHDPVPPRANWPEQLRVTHGPEQSSFALIGNALYWGASDNDAGFCKPRTHEPAPAALVGVMNEI